MNKTYPTTDELLSSRTARVTVPRSKLCASCVPWLSSDPVTSLDTTVAVHGHELEACFDTAWHGRDVDVESHLFIDQIEFLVSSSGIEEKNSSAKLGPKGLWTAEFELDRGASGGDAVAGIIYAF